MRSSWTSHVVVAVFAAAAIGCGNAAPGESAAASDLTQVSFSSRVHKMPLRTPGSVAPRVVPPGAHLTYYGGRVISNVNVIEVLYGAGSYESHLTATTTPSISSFFAAVTNSSYFDWLTEYDTTVPGGTNQTIGRGTFGGQVTITPSAARNGTTISDAQIQAELAAQIAAGTLPPVTFDAAGNPNTYYAVFFPPGKTIVQGGSSSCVSGGFCAYHGAFTQGSHDVYYGVHPDLQSPSGCDLGCGNAATTFGNEMVVASHEMIEAVTDPELALAVGAAAPLAWDDDANGEIGDLCNAQASAFVGGDGAAYTVQPEFDNATSSCIVNQGGNEFSLTANPASLSIAQGTSKTASIGVPITVGSAQSVSLSISGAPAGVTATLNPAVVNSGASSVLTVSAAGAAPVGAFTLTVTGAGTSGSHATSVTVTISAAPVPCTTTTQLLGNPGFETTASWSASPFVLRFLSGGVHVARSGSGYAWLDGYGTTHTDTLSQIVVIPANACSATFSFWFKIDTAETTGSIAFDIMTVTANSTRLIALSNLNHGTAYAQRTFDLSAFKGQAVMIKFTATEDVSLQTSFLIDDTALTVVQ